MSQQEGESADVFPQETRSPLPEFLTGRLAWIGLGTVTSLVLASVAFAQGAWNGGDETGSRTPAVEPDQASETLPSTSSTFSPPSVLALDSSVGRPSTRAKSSPEADREPAHRPAEGTPAASVKDRGSDSTGGASRAGGGTSVTQTTPKSEPLRSESSPTTAVQPSLTAWSSRQAEDNPYWDAHTVTVRSTVPITSLKLSVRVIQTGGVTDTGAWSSLGDQADIWSAANGNELDYYVALKPGVTLQPGTYTFQFGFNHDMGTRDTGRDLWNIVATADGFNSSQMRSGRF